MSLPSTAKSVATPYSITGSGNTIDPDSASAEISIDWLAFTFLVGSKVKYPENIPAFLGITAHPVIECPRGLNGYKKQYNVGGVIVLYDGTIDMGFHVIIGGRALRDHFKNPVELIQKVLFVGGKFTRIDIALDDYEGLIPHDRISEYTLNGCCSSTSRKFSKLQTGRVSDGEIDGQGFQIGSRTSHTISRFYDKRLERIEKGDPEDIEKLPEHWNRFEVEIKGDSAAQCAEKLLVMEDLRTFALGLVTNLISFREKSETDSNKSRWKIAEWWQAFVSNVEAIKISRTKSESTTETKHKWFVRQVAPSFAYLLHRFGADHMQELYKAGKLRLEGDDEGLIEQLDLLRRMNLCPF